MEAMEEHQVTSAGKRYKLEQPFYVFATQNPIEQEGTYPLPVAQLDRFMFEVNVDYPTWDEEYKVATMTTSDRSVELQSLISRDEIMDLLQIVRKVEVPDPVLRYAADIARATRLQTDSAPGFIKDWLQWGVGPRGGLYLVLGAKASAMLDGRATVSPADVRRVARPVLCHRLITTYQADAEGMTPDKIVDKLLEHVPAPDGVGAA
jgi:MoxR-like ATPase